MAGPSRPGRSTPECSNTGPGSVPEPAPPGGHRRRVQCPVHPDPLARAVCEVRDPPSSDQKQATDTPMRRMAPSGGGGQCPRRRAQPAGILSTGGMDAGTACWKSALARTA